MHSPLDRTHLWDNWQTNADKVSSPKISPGDVSEFFAVDKCREARQKASSLQRNNMAWAEQQCSSHGVTLIRHFEELMKAAASRGVLNISFSEHVYSGHNTNSPNIPDSHFHVWLLTKMDTEGDVKPHSTHFSSQVTHPAKPSVGGKTTGFESEDPPTVWKVLEAKRENILLNLQSLVPQTSYSLAPATQHFSMLTAHILQASKSSSSF